MPGRRDYGPMGEGDVVELTECPNCGWGSFTGMKCDRCRRPKLHEVAPGVSTTTVVDLITATASAPGSRPISRTASLDISETIRCGPHCISTCAITRSVTTDVTRPTSRLRAELCTSDGSGGAVACSRANAASAAPSMT